MRRVQRIHLVLGAILAFGSPAAAQPGPQVDPFVQNAAQGQREMQRISTAELVDAPITNIFRLIADTTGWSIIVSPALSERPPRINIWLRNMAPDQALERIGAVANLVIDRRGSVVEVMTFDEYARIRGVEKRVIPLKHVAARDLAATLQPLVDKDQAKVLPDAETNRLVLLIHPPVLLESLLKLIETLDVPFERDAVRVIKLKNVDASDLVFKLEEFLGGGVRAATAREPAAPRPAPGAAAPAPPAGGPGAPPAPAGAAPLAVPVNAGPDPAGTSRAGERWQVQFMVQPDLNAIILRGLPGDVTRAESLITELDVPSDLTVIGYPLRFTNAREAFQTINELVAQDQRGLASGQGPNGRSDRQELPRLRIAASEQNNQIVVQGSAQDHERMTNILRAVDRPLPAGSGGIRIYRLENSTAEEVANVIAAIIEQRNSTSALARQAGASDQPASEPGVQRIGPVSESLGGGSRSGQSSSTYDAQPAPNIQGASPAPAAGDVLPPVVSAAPEINAVIIRASAADHEEFASLIKELDRPRDQVLLEVTLVAVVSSEAFNFGLEFAGAKTDGTQIIGFSSFGVGSVNPSTGMLSFDAPPPLGLNLGVFESDQFSMVLNALKAVGDTRVTSAPRILVEDNAPAQISQLNREPYAVASQGNNSTITSFGGFADAGTSLIVTPHIAEKDWLRLEYQINLSSFDQRTAQQLAANLPPPIRQNQSQGIVRLPSDHTVVLGGLVSRRTDQSRDGIPILSELPLVGPLFGTTSDNTSNETLFIFIRPVVLRDLAFRDLRYLSETDKRRARITHQDYPQNELKSIVPRSASTQERGEK